MVNSYHIEQYSSTAFSSFIYMFFSPGCFYVYVNQSLACKGHKWDTLFGADLQIFQAPNALLLISLTSCITSELWNVQLDILFWSMRFLMAPLFTKEVLTVGHHSWTIWVISIRTLQSNNTALSDKHRPTGVWTSKNAIARAVGTHISWTSLLSVQGQHLRSWADMGLLIQFICGEWFLETGCEGRQKGKLARNVISAEA